LFFMRFGIFLVLVFCLGLVFATEAPVYSGYDGYVDTEVFEKQFDSDLEEKKEKPHVVTSNLSVMVNSSGKVDVSKGILYDIGLHKKEDGFCEEFGEKIMENGLGIKIPSGVPFSDEIFEVSVDSEVFGYFEFRNKGLFGFFCEEVKGVTYLVDLNSSLLNVDFEEVEDFVGFYNEKKKSGEIVIKGVSFGKKFKLGVLNFGAKILGWF